VDQFAADARASYGFYGTDVDWTKSKASALAPPFPCCQAIFWALLLKLTPARRVLLLAALVMLVLSSGKQTGLQI